MINLYKEAKAIYTKSVEKEKRKEKEILDNLRLEQETFIKEMIKEYNGR